MKNVECAVCGSNNSGLLYRTEDLYLGIPGKFSIVKCAVCGFVFLNPQLSGEDFEKYYPNYYFTRANNGIVTEADEKRLHKIYRKRGELVKECKNFGDLLDVGSGDGLFLHYLMRIGWKGRLTGIEPSNKAAGFSKTLGVDVYQGDLGSVDLGKEKFDLVTFWEVLEHLPELNFNLRKAYDVLRSGGVLSASVPNYGSLQSIIFGKYWNAIDAPRHFYQFTAKDIQTILEKNNFKNIRIRSTSILRFNMDGYSESLRFFLRTRGLYPKKAGLTQFPDDRVLKRSFIRKILAACLHSVEFIVFLPIEILGLLFNRGSVLFITAEKK